jgi:hypothetical protein
MLRLKEPPEENEDECFLAESNPEGTGFMDSAAMFQAELELAFDASGTWGKSGKGKGC